MRSVLEKALSFSLLEHRKKSNGLLQFALYLSRRAGARLTGEPRLQSAVLPRSPRSIQNTIFPHKASRSSRELQPKGKTRKRDDRALSSWAHLPPSRPDAPRTLFPASLCGGRASRRAPCFASLPVHSVMQMQCSIVRRQGELRTLHRLPQTGAWLQGQSSRDWVNSAPGFLVTKKSLVVVTQASHLIANAQPSEHCQRHSPSFKGLLNSP